MYSIWYQMLKIASAYDAPHAPSLVVTGFLPSAIAASRLRRSQSPFQLLDRGCAPVLRHSSSVVHQYFLSLS